MIPRSIRCIATCCAHGRVPLPAGCATPIEGPGEASVGHAQRTRSKPALRVPGGSARPISIAGSAPGPTPASRRPPTPSRRDVCRRAKPLQPLRSETVSSYQITTRSVHSSMGRRGRRGPTTPCPRGLIGCTSRVQWDDRTVRILDRRTGRSCASIGAISLAATVTTDEDQPRRTP